VIVNHRHRFILLKTKETVETSIECVPRYCGPDDITTFISADDEEVLRQEIRGVGPLNHKGSPYKHAKQSIRRILFQRFLQRGPLYWCHMGAHNAPRIAGRNVWNSYYKSGCGRNRGDKVVAAHYWRQRKVFYDGDNPPISFGGGDIAVHFVGKYEISLDHPPNALDNVGVENDKWIPKAKSSTRKKHFYRELHGGEERELKLLGYAF